MKENGSNSNNERDYETLHKKGNELYNNGDFIGAINCYSEVLENRKLPESYFNRALAYTRLKEYFKAEQDLNIYLELQPEDEVAYYTRGLVKEYEEDYVGATRDYTLAYAYSLVHKKDSECNKALLQQEICVKKVLDSSGQRSRKAKADKIEYFDELTDFKPFIDESTDLTLEDYGGDEKQIRLFKELCVLLKSKDVIKKRGGRTPNGILLSGPPGTGKTYLARIFANECSATLFYVKSTDIYSQWLGHSGKNMQSIFDEASKHERSIIFFDEIDAITPRRNSGIETTHAERRVLSSLLINMDGLGNEKYDSVIVMGATNDFEKLDPAMLRAGRFTYIIWVDKPNAKARKDIYKIQLRTARKRAQEPLISDNIDYSKLAELSEGFVGDDIREVVKRAINNQIIWEIKSNSSPYRITTSKIIKVIEEYRKSRLYEKDKKAGFL